MFKDSLNNQGFINPLKKEQKKNEKWHWLILISCLYKCYLEIKNVNVYLCVQVWMLMFFFFIVAVPKQFIPTFSFPVC